MNLWLKFITLVILWFFPSGFIQIVLHENHRGQELMFHLQPYRLTNNQALNGIPCNLYNLLLADDREVFYLKVAHRKEK